MGWVRCRRTRLGAALALWMALGVGMAADVPAARAERAWSVSPLVSWSGEQGFGLGARLMLVGLPPARRRFLLSAYFAQEDYSSIETRYRTLRFLGRDLSLRTSAVWVDDGSVRFYGVGNDSRHDDRDDYRKENFYLSVEPGRPLRGNWEARLRLRFESTSTDLGGSEVGVGADTVAAGMFMDLRVAGVLQRDTRDVEWAPTAGSLQRIEVGHSLPSADADYWRLGADIRAWRALDYFGHWVLAGRAEVLALEGEEIPFFLMPALGARPGRGFGLHRFRDRVRTSASSELRWQPLANFGLVGFVDAGWVAPGLFREVPSRVHMGTGVGVRTLPGGRGHIVRVDGAWGGREEGWHLYLGFGHAF